MGGFGSGQSGGRPIVEHCKVIDLALMFRRGSLAEHCSGGGSLSWSCGGEPAGSIAYHYDLSDLDDASMTLSYRRKPYGGDWIDERQFVRLVHTAPRFGGRRWWMICPVRGHRVAKLYLPNSGDIFAGRKAWRLGYRSQRVTSRDAQFERLFSLQRKLGCDQGWDAGLFRPKGMWHRTFERHLDRYWELNDECTVSMMGAILRFR